MGATSTITPVVKESVKYIAMKAPCTPGVRALLFDPQVALSQLFLSIMQQHNAHLCLDDDSDRHARRAGTDRTTILRQTVEQHRLG